MLIRDNLKDVIESSMSISSESDRKLIEIMVGSNIIRNPISLELLAHVIDNSYGGAIKYYMSDNSIVYFDSLGRYISDYKNEYEKPILEEAHLEEIRLSIIDLETSSLEKNTNMSSAFPMFKKPNETIEFLSPNGNYLPV